MAPKNKKSNTNTPKIESVITEPVVVIQQAAISDPVVQPKQKGGKKKVSSTAPAPAVLAAVVDSEPVVINASQETPVAPQKGGRKKKAPVVSTDTDAPEPAKLEKKSGRSKNNASTTEPETTDALVEESPEGRVIRSFKVKLPQSEDFEGRFTGLTPYQAANKALSKYFREADSTSVHGEITFSICESTRKSRKNVYTYIGQRHKLEVPVKYTIQDGREIVKNFKNTLKKVKKNLDKGQAQTETVSA